MLANKTFLVTIAAIMLLATTEAAPASVQGTCSFMIRQELQVSTVC